jgi:signal transduction histidine kinase
MMTTKAKGQGFGLAASKRIIEAMKGTISFESEKGKGTKFLIELPTVHENISKIARSLFLVLLK